MLKNIVKGFEEMLRSGYSYAEIAKACGVPESTVYSALNK